MDAYSPILLDYSGCVFSDVCPFKAGSKYSQLVFLLAELLSKFKLSSLTTRATTERKYRWICAGDGLRPDRCLLSNSWRYGFGMPEASSPSDETLYDEVIFKVRDIHCPKKKKKKVRDIHNWKTYTAEGSVMLHCGLRNRLIQNEESNLLEALLLHIQRRGNSFFARVTLVGSIQDVRSS